MDEQEAWGLVVQHSGLVKKVLLRFCKQYVDMDFDDLYSAAQIGCYKAALRWNPEKAQFSTWAWWGIWYALHKERDAIRRQTGIFTQVGPAPEGSAGKVRYEKREHLSDPSKADVDDEADSDVFIRLAEPSFEDEVVERLSSEDEFWTQFPRVMEELTVREMEIIRLRYWHGLTFDEAGEKLGITRSAAAKRHAGAMAKFHAILGMAA